MNFHIYDLRMEQTTDDPALLQRRSIYRLLSLSATYVDDKLHAPKKEDKQGIEDRRRSKFGVNLLDENALYKQES